MVKLASDYLKEFDALVEKVGWDEVARQIHEAYGPWLVNVKVPENWEPDRPEDLDKDDEPATEP